MLRSIWHVALIASFNGKIDRTHYHKIHVSYVYVRTWYIALIADNIISPLFRFAETHLSPRDPLENHSTPDIFTVLRDAISGERNIVTRPREIVALKTDYEAITKRKQRYRRSKYTVTSASLMRICSSTCTYNTFSSIENSFRICNVNILKLCKKVIEVILHGHQKSEIHLRYPVHVVEMRWWPAANERDFNAAQLRQRQTFLFNSHPSCFRFSQHRRYIGGNYHNCSVSNYAIIALPCIADCTFLPPPLLLQIPKRPFQCHASWITRIS